MEDCIFCKIANKTVKADMIYEDGNMVVIKDISPMAKVHYLAVPKIHKPNIVDIDEGFASILGYMLKKIGELADSWGLKDGFRLVINKGKDACQSVDHLHIHVLGGEQLNPGFN